MQSIRQWLARQVRRFAAWVDVPLPDAFRDRVETLVAQADAFHASGEYKRHTVYARVQKEYPTTPHHVIGLAIEQAITRLREVVEK